MAETKAEKENGMNDLELAHVKFSIDGHSGAGWYAWSEAYPEDGSLFFESEPSNADLAKCGYRRG